MGEDGGESSESESSGDVLTEAEREKIRAEAAAEREALLRSCFEPQEPQDPARGEAAAKAAAQVARRPPKVKLVPERQLPPCLFRAPLTRWLPGAPLPKEALRAPAIALPPRAE